VEAKLDGCGAKHNSDLSWAPDRIERIKPTTRVSKSIGARRRLADGRHPKVHRIAEKTLLTPPIARGGTLLAIGQSDGGCYRLAGMAHSRATVMKRLHWLVAAAAIFAVGGAVAEAGHGNSGRHYNYNRGFYSGPRVSFYSGGLPGVYYGRSGHGHHGHGHHHWHDTSHYDFHPGGYERHYDHYHYVPSHYDWHREGHWDHHH
jgi:hypothetical protein